MKGLSDKNLDRLNTQFSHIISLYADGVSEGDILEEIEILKMMFLSDKNEDDMTLSAQLSIYPLRQPSLSLTINEALEVLQRFGLNVFKGSMSTLVLGQQNKVWSALKKVFSTASSHGQVVMIITLSNACPKPKAQSD